MKLIPEASAALDRLRRVESGEEIVHVYRPKFTAEDRTHWGQGALDRYMIDLRNIDRGIVSQEMLRLFPLGHDAIITQERLLACGFVPHADAPHVMEPTNMGEVWSLMECCGIEVKHDSH